MKNLQLLFILVVIVLAGCASGEERWKKGIVSETFIYEEAPFPSCHAATIEETPEGLIAAWFGGTHERHPDVCIYTSRYVDGAWTEPVNTADGVVNDTLRYPTWNPVLFQVPEGALWLFYKAGPSPSTWKGYMKTSNDAGKTWSEVRALPEGFIGPVKNKPVQLESGTILCGSSTEGDAWRIHMEATDPEAKEWAKTGFMNDGKTFQAIQPTILQHPDGVLQILCRSKNRVIVESWSYDDGKTWSLFQESDLPNNNSGFDGVTLSDGRHVLVYNHVKTPANAGKGYRTPLNISVSKDGRTWYAAAILEDSEISQYSYPAVIQGSDGMLHIVYTWRREKIKYVRVDPDKLKLSRIMDEKWPSK
ncbi:MAG: exo-alpha-sialidase [Bacteroidales bacterium]|nr:exo-alpha-sialidase [Bacteroidales bacterium]